MQERRRHPRVESVNLVSVGRVQEGPMRVARTLVLSEGGALLELTEPCSVHTLITLDVALEEDLLQVQAEVRDVAATDRGTYKVGVRFVNLEEDAHQKLQEHLKEKLHDEAED